jgi:hypothetical protein
MESEDIDMSEKIADLLNKFLEKIPPNKEWEELLSDLKKCQEEIMLHIKKYKFECNEKEILQKEYEYIKNVIDGIMGYLSVTIKK